MPFETVFPILFRVSDQRMVRYCKRRVWGGSAIAALSHTESRMMPTG
jgi:hypothetical protein